MAGNFPEIVHNELLKARTKHPQNIRSGHEAFGVIQEEVDEFWELVKRDASPEEMLKEVKQIAAMCQRAAEDLGMVTSPLSPTRERLPASSA